MIRSVSFLCALSMLVIGSVRSQPIIEPEVLDIPGIVTDYLGEPIAGADISVLECSREIEGWPIAQREVAHTQSGADGRFLFKKIKLTKLRRDYWIRANAAGFAYGGTTFARDGAQTFVDLIRYRSSDKAWIVLLPAQSLEGTVDDEQGNPVAGAKVFEASSRTFQTTAADGKFAFDKAPPLRAGAIEGSCELFVVHPDYAAADLRRSVFGHRGTVLLGRAPVTVTLERGVIIRGKISDHETGQPVPGAIVEATEGFDSIGRRARTDAKGQYVLRIARPSSFMPHGAVHLRLSDTSVIDEAGADYRPIDDVRDIELPSNADEINDVNLEMEPDLVLRGTLNVADGTSLSGKYEMQAFAVPENSHRLMGTGQIEQNLFIVRGLQPGGYELHLFRHKTDGLPEVLLKQTVDVTNSPAPIELTVPPFDPLPPLPPSIYGTVRDSSGKVVKLGRMCIDPQGGGAFTDLDGEYQIDHVTDFRGRRMWAWSASMDEAAIVDLPERYNGKQPFDVQLRPAAQISGFIHDPSGQGIADMDVSLAIQDRNSLTPLMTTETDENGRYVMKGILPPGEGTDLVIEVLPRFDQREHYNTSIGIRSISAGIAADAKLDGYDFSVDTSKPQIEVKADLAK